MNRSNLKDEDEFFSPPSIYDGEEGEDDDLWFLPPQAEGDLDGDEADAPFFFDLRSWQEAERDLLLDISDTAFHIGILSQKITSLGEGIRDRLTRMEAAELSWVSGERMPLDRLHSALALRKMPSSPEQVETLQNIIWAWRAYQKNLDPLEDDIRLLLDRHEAKGLQSQFLGGERQDQQASALGILSGEAFMDRYEEWNEAMGQSIHLHPFTRSALAFFMWQAIEVTGGYSLYEGAVIAQKVGRFSRRNALGFLPLASSGRPVFKRVGTVNERLARWVKGANNASLRCLLEVERIEDWKYRTEPVLKTRRGGNLEALRDIFVQNPVVSAEVITTKLDVSHATAMRLLEVFLSEYLVEEVTGYSRFRLWRIAGEGKLKHKRVRPEAL